MKAKRRLARVAAFFSKGKENMQMKNFRTAVAMRSCYCIAALMACQGMIAGPAMAEQSCLGKVEGLSADIDFWAETARKAPLTHTYQSQDELVQSLEGLSKLAREAALQCEAREAALKREAEKAAGAQDNPNRRDGPPPESTLSDAPAIDLRKDNP